MKHFSYALMDNSRHASLVFGVWAAVSSSGKCSGQLHFNFLFGLRKSWWYVAAAMRLDVRRKRPDCQSVDLSSNAMAAINSSGREWFGDLRPGEQPHDGYTEHAEHSVSAECCIR